MSAIFPLPGCLPTDLESIPHASTSTSIIPTRFEVDMTINCRVIELFVCWYVTWLCDLDLWLFDLEQMSYMANHVTNLANKYEDPTHIRSWVTSYNVSRWLPLKMRRPLRGHFACTVSRDPWVGGEKRLHFWYAGPRFAYSLYNFGGSTMNIIIVICENNARPVLKNAWDSAHAHARNHVICLRWPKCLNAVVLADVDLPYWT